MKSKYFKIGNKYVGEEKKVFIIAEIGVNHEGNFKKCINLFKQAKISGADAVKLQTINPDYNYVKGTKSYKEFKDTDFSNLQYSKLKKIANKLNLVFFSTPGSLHEVDRIVKIGAQAIKISSGLLTNLPLIKYASKKNLPLIISTGMAYKNEIKDALNSTGSNKRVAILKCTSLYPAPDHSLNISSINKLKKLFNTVVGFSDHTLDDLSCISAVAAGAKIIEKHFTLNKNKLGKDHKISLEPKEFKIMVDKIRRIEKMLGHKKIEPNRKEIKFRKTFHRCLVAGKVILKNERFNSSNVMLKRPKSGQLGLGPKFYEKFIGRINKKKIHKDQLLQIKNLK